MGLIFPVFHVANYTMTCANLIRNAIRFSEFLKPNLKYNVTVYRGRKQWLRPYLVSVYKRRIDQGPEPERPRSAWINWNYEAEIFSFGQRLGEDFNSKTLKMALTNKSYVLMEREKRRKSLGLDDDDDTQIHLNDNEKLQHLGCVVANDYIMTYLQDHYPIMPSEETETVTSYLLSNEILARVALNLGLKDLTLTEEFPPSIITLSNTLKAVIGALCQDKGNQRAERFVQDFILTQLIGKTISDIWKVANPMGLLKKILDKQGRGIPEPRLLWSSGSETILATYMVGIYSDKKLIGQSAGETVTLAEEMAALDGLNRIFKTTNGSAPLSFGKKDHDLKLNICHNETML